MRPGARVSDIRLAYRGATGLRLARDGTLLVGTPLGTLRDSPPHSYQLTGGKRLTVPSRYTLVGTRSYGFAVGTYDAAGPLVIDPGLEYSTFLGGTRTEFPNGIAVDKHGNAFVTGTTTSPDYPTTPGVFDRGMEGGADAFVTKLDRAGSALLYSTLLGGSAGDSGRAIAVDERGNAYIAGSTTSDDFPTTVRAFDPTFNGGPDEGLPDGFVAKLDRFGSALVYSTFLGGHAFDDINGGIAVDEKGSAFVLGMTESTDFPTTAGAFDETLNADPIFGLGTDAFVTKLDPAGSSLVYSSFLGGTSDEFDLNGSRIAVDQHGRALVTGETWSQDFPVTAEAYDREQTGGADVYVTRFNRDGSALEYSTYLGGTSSERSRAIGVDRQGNAYVTGFTFSSDYPVTPGAFAGPDSGFGVPDSGFGVFVTKLERNGSTLVYSTILGIGGGRGIAVHEDGSAVVTGGASADYPTTAGGFDRTFDGFTDAFVTKLNRAGSALVYSTFLGGTEGGTDEEPGFDQANAVALDTHGNAFVTGITTSPDYPTTAGAFDATYSDDFDAFVTKLDFSDKGG